MRILALETTGPHCSVALVEGQASKVEWIIQKKSTQQRNHLKSLAPMIREVMIAAAQREESGWEEIAMEELWKTVNHIAVSAGPGSYTGIRIGVATGRALSQVTGVPLISVPTLAAFGRGIEVEEREDAATIVCPILDARRKQVYGGAYCGEETIVKDGPYLIREFLAKLEKQMEDIRSSSAKHPHILLHFVGDGIDPCREIIESWAAHDGHVIRMEKEVQSAVHVAYLAMEMADQWSQRPGRVHLSAEELQPQYMRMAEAEKKLMEKREDISIRKATAADVDLLTDMDRLCFSAPWSRESFEKEMGHEELVHYLIAQKDGKAVAYAGMWIIAGEGHITNVGVLPAYRRKGIAKRILTELFDQGKAKGVDELTLEVRRDNEAAIALYQSMGFSVEGVRPHYYEDDGTDALIMWRRR